MEENNVPKEPIVPKDEVITKVDLTPEDESTVEEHERLSPHVMFEIIRRDGLEEMQRPTRSLIYSGIAAGIIISFSFFCNAALEALLPPTPWSPIISKWGYSVGFIIVILGRMQLFTENTITTVVPVFKPFSFFKVLKALRLWLIVFLSNLVGTTLAALFLSIPNAVNPTIHVALVQLANHVTHMTVLENIVRGVPAGILIASIVWMLPNSRGLSLILIAVVTYFIALGDLAHVVVGSCEMAFAVIHGDASLYDYFFRFLIPTGLGNILGGTGVFTLLVYGQITEELPLKKVPLNKRPYGNIGGLFTKLVNRQK